MPAGSPANGRFMSGAAARRRGAAPPIFGECGGYMVLGAGLVDPDGEFHAMAALLPLQTSFAERRLHLGYRRARLATGLRARRSRRRLPRP